MRRRRGLAVIAAALWAPAWAASPPQDARGLSGDAAPLAARFKVSITSPADPSRARTADWIFVRSAEGIELRKGAIDEEWTRDAQGRITFQRTFHDYAKVVDYSPGELATLGVDLDWQALSGFIDPRELALLTVKASSGKGQALRLRLEGRSAGQRLRVDWLPALQLPALVLRENAGGGHTRIELKAHANPLQAPWAQPDGRAAAYLHLDAADFGDMDYEPVVRLSEALDIRSGWRRPHRHD